MLSFYCVSVKNRVLSHLKEKQFEDAVKLYSAAVEAFPGNAFFKAGSAALEIHEGEGDEEDDVIDDAERRIERLVNGLRIVLFCKFIFFFLPDKTFYLLVE